MKVRKLAEYYKEKGYPKRTDPDPEVRKLNIWLKSKRYSPKITIYEGEKELGISLGLPEDWLGLIPKTFNPNEKNRTKPTFLN